MRSATRSSRYLLCEMIKAFGGVYWVVPLLIDSLYRLKWVVFCRKPFKSPLHVVRYLGRYTHRVAISNTRILSFNGQFVSFSWKDYKDKGKSKVISLEAAEFTKRFLLHVLPDAFVKIRHYGLLCSRNIRTSFQNA
jgi:hypothetical protein